MGKASNSEVVKAVEAEYWDHPGFRHEIWDWFAHHELSLEDLQLFAELYYPHVQRFRHYLAGALTVAPSEELQTALAEIMADEYGIHLAGHEPEKSHPELFRDFMRSLGITEQEWDSFEPIEGIRRFRAMHFALFTEATQVEAIGAVVFGMENSTPHRHSHVVQGIKRYSERSGAVVDDTFFAAHVEIDEHHSELLFRTAMPILLSDTDAIVRGAKWSFDARKVMLDDILKQLKHED